MARRSKMSGSASRSNFKRGATHTHVKNLRATPLRGGIRL